MISYGCNRCDEKKKQEPVVIEKEDSSIGSDGPEVDVLKPKVKIEWEELPQ